MFGLMLQNNLKYSFNGFSDNCQIYANVGNVGSVSGHNNHYFVNGVHNRKHQKPYMTHSRVTLG